MEINVHYHYDHVVRPGKGDTCRGCNATEKEEEGGGGGRERMRRKRQKEGKGSEGRETMIAEEEGRLSR